MPAPVRISTVTGLSRPSASATGRWKPREDARPARGRASKIAPLWVGFGSHCPVYAPSGHWATLGQAFDAQCPVCRRFRGLAAIFGGRPPAWTSPGCTTLGAEPKHFLALMSVGVGKAGILRGLRWRFVPDVNKNVVTVYAPSGHWATLGQAFDAQCPVCRRFRRGRLDHRW
jgi:hypothetical protein